VTSTDEIVQLINQLPDVEQRAVFAVLRKRIPIHPMEKTLMAPAETILEAIARSNDLTVRGIEGIIAESSFIVEVVPTLHELQSKQIVGDQPYDALLQDADGDIRVQVKMQRRRKRKPLMANQQLKAWPSDHFVVETQRTRSGKKGEKKTRPYRFGSFDILAVSMGASRGRWSAFVYTLDRWLLPSLKDATCLRTYQPVPPKPTDCWTEDFMECVAWLRSGVEKQIPG